MRTVPLLDDPTAEALGWLGRLLAWEDQLAALRAGDAQPPAAGATSESAA